MQDTLCPCKIHRLKAHNVTVFKGKSLWRWLRQMEPRREGPHPGVCCDIEATVGFVRSRLDPLRIWEGRKVCFFYSRNTLSTPRGQDRQLSRVTDARALCEGPPQPWAQRELAKSAHWPPFLSSATLHEPKLSTHCQLCVLSSSFRIYSTGNSICAGFT